MHTHPRLADPGRFPKVTLVGSSLALVGSMWIESEIGGAVLYGAFAAFLVGTLLYMAIASVPSQRDVTREATTFSLLGGVRLRTDLERETGSRLLGSLVVANRTRRPVQIAGIQVSRPTGSRIALCGEDDADAITVRFDGPREPMAMRIRPGETRSRRFRVLLPGESADEPRVRLDVEFDEGGVAHTRSMTRRLPG